MHCTHSIYCVEASEIRDSILFQLRMQFVQLYNIFAFIYRNKIYIKTFLNIKQLSRPFYHL